MAESPSLRLGAFEPRSRVNGPGTRAVIWAQGCDRRCPGCCNPEFLAPDGGEAVAVADLLARIEAAGPIDGISLSGGEPFRQAGALAAICRQVRLQGLSVVCFTGHSLQELRGGDDPTWAELLAEIDLLIAGPYLQEQPCEDPLRASKNQELWFLTDRIAAHDLRGLPRVEVLVRDGEIMVSGFSPQMSAHLRAALEAARDTGDPQPGADG